MNNEEIKQKLKGLYPEIEDFTVIQTGKKSKKVNGLYKPATKEIILHNNFGTSNELMYTAIHEFTHHYCITVLKLKGGHNAKFWQEYNNFLDEAEKQGLYSRKRSEKVETFVKEIKEIESEIQQLNSKLKETLCKLQEVCKEENERVEDVIYHDCQISRTRFKEISTTDYESANSEIAKIISSTKPENKEAVKKAVEDNKTIDQIKAIAKAKPVETDPFALLVKERNRLEKIISQLNDRLELVQEEILSMEKSDAEIQS